MNTVSENISKDSGALPTDTWAESGCSKTIYSCSFDGIRLYAMYKIYAEHTGKDSYSHW